MTSLIDALAGIVTDSAPEYQPTGGGCTAAQVRDLLDNNGLKYRTTKKPGRDDGLQFDLLVCPLCNQTEGNPAVWVENDWPVFKCQRANSGCAAKTFADLKALFAKPQLIRISARDLLTNYRKPRQIIVDGLIRLGDVVNVIGGPKTRKSFWVMLLAICIASGRPFLGRKTTRGKVLLVDNELAPDDLGRRLRDKLDALGLTIDDIADYFEVLCLRGKLADLRTIQAEVSKSPPGTYDLVVVDALYKALPKDCDENSNSDMTAAYVLLDETAEKQSCAVVAVHHTSKGAQHQKSVSDMGSGAGAQSRSADVHVVLREHEDKDTIVLQAIVRSQKPVEPVCLTFHYPLWRVAEDKSPDAVAVVNKKAVPTLEAFLKTIPTSPVPKTAALERSKQLLCAARNTILALLHEAISQGLVEIKVPENRTLPQTIRRVEQKDGQ